MVKKIIIVAVVILVIVVVVQLFSNNGNEKFETAEVIRGNVSEEISETGQVQKGDKINLSFKSAGRLESIYVKVGETVGRGTLLAKIDTANLSIQLQEAEAALSINQAKLDKLLAGASSEEIKKYQTAVENKQVALETEEQDLQDAYDDALNELDDAYLLAYNAGNKVDEIQISYFRGTDQEGIAVKEDQGRIHTAISGIKSYVDTVNENSSQGDIDSALSGSRNELNKISDSLADIREICETANYRNIVSSADKTSLDTHRSNINAAIADLLDDQQAVESAKLSIETAEGNLQAAEDDLAFISAPPRQEDIDLYQSQVNQSRAQVDVLENQIDDAYLRSPVKGEIADIKKRTGELVQQDVVMVILPSAPFEIEVNIYEEDIVKVDVDNPVDIFLVAFPDQTFSGKVISIDPAEKLIDEVVYYKVIVAFDETPQGARSGMTADLVIETASREDVLLIPEDAVQKIEEKTMVKVLKDGVVSEREVVLGLEGEDYFEVISGLQEGEEVILD